METIEAFADETVFRNDENGYTVLVVKAGKSRVSAVGVMPPVTSGEKLRITGEWTEHPVYGRQIKVQSLEIEQPTTLPKPIRNSQPRYGTSILFDLVKRTR